MKKRFLIKHADGKEFIIQGEDIRFVDYFNYRIFSVGLNNPIVVIPATSMAIDMDYIAKDVDPQPTQDIPQPVPIKETGHLGITLDTERPWNTDEPNNNRDVGAKLQDGRVANVWFACATKSWRIKNGDISSADWPHASPDNPVVAWRELEK